MQELIKVTEQNGEQLVSARELHEFLESKQDFTTWIKSRIEKYGFVENEDFTLHKFMVGKSIAHDYILKLDMAKELSMVEGNEKGSQARRYFLNCEKKLKEIIQKPLSIEEMIIKQAESMIQVKNDIQRLESKFDTVVTLESGKQRKIQLAVASRVYKLVDEYTKGSYGYDSDSQYDLDIYKDHLKRITFSGIYRDIKRKFGVASYKDIKVVEYEKALEFINFWIEDKEVI